MITRNKLFRGLFALLIMVAIFSSQMLIQAADVTITNGTQFSDTSGNVVHAHGGCLVKSGSNYYWFGEYRDGSKFNAVKCYRSTDLKNWTFVRDALSKTSAAELNSCNVERPKVMYCPNTGQYVMWMHWENGVDYSEARCAVAYSSSVEGPYTYLGSFRPLANTGVTDHGKPGYMSRDCTVFVDGNTGYFMSAANENMDLHLYQLSSDFRSITSLAAKLFAGQQREAPCLFKRGSYYFLLTSGCTGWTPNQAKYAYSTSLTSGWSSLINIGDSTTYSSQPAFVIPVSGSTTTTYLYTGDRWAGAWGGVVNDSQYVWLPLNFSSNTSMSMNWYNSITINTETGVISGSNAGVTYYKIKSRACGKMLDNKGSTSDGANIVLWSDTNSYNQQWQRIDMGGGYYRFMNRATGKYIDGMGRTGDGSALAQYSSSSSYNQQWQIIDVGGGYVKLANRATGKRIDSAGYSSDGSVVKQYNDSSSYNQQWQLIATQ
ncbi:MAG: RICIN domain-containing protein [Firmicutes bacterium]|nr:RICIN domain-containing protein [Bacillota bacterium]